MKKLKSKVMFFITLCILMSFSTANATMCPQLGLIPKTPKPALCHGEWVQFQDCDFFCNCRWVERCVYQ